MTDGPMTGDTARLEKILDRSLQGRKPSAGEVLLLLRRTDPPRLNALFETARAVRRRHFGDSVFLYGFLNISTFCRNDCRFCYYRRSNAQSRRYRKAPSEIVAAAHRLSDAGVHLIDLTMGEDPAFYGDNERNWESLAGLVGTVRRTTNLPVMVSPGVVSGNVMERLAAAGADWYACYQETHSRRLFARLRPDQDFDRRLSAKSEARGCGLLIEEGILCGVGETPEDVAGSMSAMDRLDADQVRVMTLVPQPGTPFSGMRPTDADAEMRITAVMRLAFPDRLIPASLDVEGLAGLKRRLDAGANVVTSMVPPDSGLAGVARHALDIDAGRRTPAAVHRVLDDLELRPADAAAYQAWVRQRRAGHGTAMAEAIGPTGPPNNGATRPIRAEGENP